MNHKDLDAWKRGVNLAKDIYILTNNFPQHEIYGLTNQMRRAAVSVSSNIAEGAARNSDKDFIKFLYISLGSLAELETQLIISQEIGYINEISINLDEVKSPILGLIKYLKGKIGEK